MGATADVPAISVVIPALGAHGVLARVLESYAAVPEAGDLELIVAIDAAEPDPGAIEALLAARPFAARAVRGEVAGASANRNAGLAAAAAPLILFTDSDVLATPGLVREHLASHRRRPEPEVAVLGHVRWAPEVRVTAFMRWLDTGMQFDFLNIEGEEAGWGRFYTANVSLKREFAELVGGFDAERLPFGYEDLDFGLRADRLGMRLLYEPEAVADHLRTYDLEFFKRRVRRTAVAEREFLSKHPDVEPWFHRMFAHAASLEPASGRGRHLIRWLPRSTPVIGERAWLSADLYYRQQLAPHFLDAWEGAEQRGDGPVAPVLGELGQVSSSGSEPGGPK